MRIINRNKKLRMVLCVTIIISLLCSNIAPTVAMALEVQDSQAVWEEVLNADLTEYQGEANPQPFGPLPSMKGGLEQGVVATEPEDALVAEDNLPSDSLEGLQTETASVSLADIWLDPTYETDRFIIKYRENAAITTIEQALKSARSVDKVDRLEVFAGRSPSKKGAAMAVLLTDTAKTVKELELQLDSAVLREIERIQPDYEMTFCSKNSAQWSVISGQLAVVNSPIPFAHYALGLQSSLPIVALLDTGVDTDHPALAGKLTDGYDFVNDTPNVNSAEWYYDQGHGTAMAGVISNGGAMVMPLKVFEGGKAYTSDIIAAIVYAEENEAQIANMSFGSRFYNPALEEAIAGSDMLFVCASGNMLVNIDKYPVYPASFNLPNVLTVASVDDEGKLARFSNYATGGVDIAARGVDISAPWLYDTTVEISGTSVSAAIVSCGAAQTLAAHSNLDAAGLKQRMVDSADTVTGLMDKVAGGRKLNVAYAVSTQPGPNTTVLDIPDPNPLPDVMLDDDIEEEYEEFGADGLITYRTPMPTAREGLRVVAVGKKIYAIGGQFNSTYYNKVEIYDTETDTWTTGANMTYGVSYFSCVAVGTDIYCFGGYNGSYRSYVQVYNTLNNTWSTKTAMPQTLMGTAAVEYNGSIFVSGGYNGSFRNYVYQYNIAGNSWTSRSGMQNARAYHNAFVYDGKMFVEGGANSTTGPYVSTEEIYNLGSFVSII